MRYKLKIKSRGLDAGSILDVSISLAFNDITTTVFEIHLEDAFKTIQLKRTISLNNKKRKKYKSIFSPLRRFVILIKMNANLDKIRGIYYDENLKVVYWSLLNCSSSFATLDTVVSLHLFVLTLENKLALQFLFQGFHYHRNFNVGRTADTGLLFLSLFSLSLAFPSSLWPKDECAPST